MLKRIVDRSQGIVSEIGGNTSEASDTETSGQADTAQGGTKRISGAFTPINTLNGFGELSSPAVDAAPLSVTEITKAEPTAKSLPGFYRRGGITRAINISNEKLKNTPLSDLAAGTLRQTYQPRPSVVLQPWLFVIAFALLLLDGFAALAVSGRLNRLRSPKMATASSLSALVFGMSLMMAGLTTSPAEAQNVRPEGSPQKERFARNGALTTRLAYVITGNNRLDRVSRQGLDGLTQMLIRRTSLEPDEPIGVDLETDEIVFFPFLYWPIDPAAPQPSAKAMAKLDTFMKTGGNGIFLIPVIFKVVLQAAIAVAQDKLHCAAFFRAWTSRHLKQYRQGMC